MKLHTVFARPDTAIIIAAGARGKVWGELEPPTRQLILSEMTTWTVEATMEF
jgi:hypothetical protein